MILKSELFSYITTTGNVDDIRKRIEDNLKNRASIEIIFYALESIAVAILIRSVDDHLLIREELMAQYPLKDTTHLPH